MILQASPDRALTLFHQLLLPADRQGVLVSLIKQVVLDTALSGGLQGFLYAVRIH